MGGDHVSCLSTKVQGVPDLMVTIRTGFQAFISSLSIMPIGLDIDRYRQYNKILPSTQLLNYNYNSFLEEIPK